MVTKEVIRATATSLINRLGCQEAAVEAINARWHGGCSKGLLSRKMHGHAEFTVMDVVALEDALGVYPLTKILARRLQGRSNGPVADCMIQQTGLIAKETGEAIAAILQAENSAGAQDRAQAITEIDEAIAALRAGRSRLEAEEGRA